MHSLRSTRRRPPLSAPRGQLRAAYRLSAELSPAAVARAEAVAEREIHELLAQPDFQELVEAVREFQNLPEEERLRQLEQMAWCVLELALADSDWRAAAFIADQIARGHNPARTIARGVIKAQARATAPPPPAAESTTPRPYEPYDAVGAAMRRSTAAMRTAIASEAVLAHTAARPAKAQRSLSTLTSEPTVPALPRRPDALTARLRAGSALPANAAADPRGLLRAWAQGP